MIALWTAAALMLAEPTPPVIGPATIDETLEVEGKAIAARQVETRMEVPVSIMGQGPFRFLVDSGADRTVIGVDLATRLALPKGPSVQVHGMAGSLLASSVAIDSLVVGQSEIGPIRAPTFLEDDLGADGLLGIDALADQRLRIDFDTKTVTIQDSRRTDREADSGEIVVVARRRHGQLILTQASVGRTPINAVIDTGAQISVGNIALLRRLKAAQAPAAEKVTLVSVTGQSVQADIYIVNGLTIGKLELSNVAVAFADVPPFKLFGLLDQPAMLIGTDVLKAFRRVALDFGGRRVRFTLRR